MGVYIYIYTIIYTERYVYIYIYIGMCIYIYIYMLTPPLTDHAACPCDGVLVAGDSADVLYLNTPHTTIICKVKLLQ